ncbi:MAG: glucose-1-phosphate adenylyltransferase [Verrucomicrobiota bacterium]
MDSPNVTHATKHTLSIIMGGGAGTRLFPLTKDRSKPAVPLAGKYRLVDIPISNCLHSGLAKIYLLTQYNSASLHRHINSAYKFDGFSDDFVEILAAQQTPTGAQWYQGTADAVRQNLRYFLRREYEYFLILSGDQLYNLDFRRVIKEHLEAGADLTIATLPVNRDDARGFGIMQTDASGTINRFEEKPSDDDVLDKLRMPPAMLKKYDLPEKEEAFQASMGIYLFNREVLEKVLDNELNDFGKHIIPDCIKEHHVHSYVFKGYWEDIGTIRAFYKANLDLCSVVPPYDFFDPRGQVYTNPRFLPGSKVNEATIKQTIVSDGSIISGAYIENCIVGVRSIIAEGSRVTNTVIMGADYFDLSGDHTAPGEPPLGIGKNCTIDQAIIDKNARIGEGCVISPEGKPENFDSESYFIRDGIVVVPKNAVIPDGTNI